jgi:hypothetical protein
VRRLLLDGLALRTQRETATLLVVEHYTPDHGRQGVGMEFFRQSYLQC